MRIGGSYIGKAANAIGTGFNVYTNMTLASTQSKNRPHPSNLVE
jgi:hypothetical protein